MEEFPYIFSEAQPSETNRKPSSIQMPRLTSEESAVIDQLEPYPIHIDELVRALTMEPGKLSSLLLQLELKGLVQQIPGKLFSIKEHLTDNPQQ